MKYVCRLAKKIKLYDGMFVLKLTDTKEGTVDENGNFAVINSDNSITRYPSFQDCIFYIDDNLKFCYCCEEQLEEVIATSDSLNVNGAITDYKEDSDNLFFLVKYNYEIDDSTKIMVIDSEIFDEMERLLAKMQILNSCSKDEVIIDISRKDLKKIVEDLENDETEYIKSVFSQILAIGNVQDTQNSVNLEDLPTPDKDEIIDPFSDLKKLIGIKDIKNNVDKLSNYLLYLNNIKENKLDVILKNPNLNMVFLGNPGTGKTTVARIISNILNKLGYSNGKFKEVSAKDLIAGYVGQTAIKTEGLLKDVKGGVLFIDEAYSLASGNVGSSFSQDALAVLLKEMENNETIFIFSGYKKEMENFISMNSGFESRISKTYIFNDYSEDELLEMFINKIKISKLKIDNNLFDTIKNIISTAKTQENFGNGRFIDKLFDDIVITHANNVSNSNNKDELITITSKDINNESIDKIIYKNVKTKKIGF